MLANPHALLACIGAAGLAAAGAAWIAARAQPLDRPCHRVEQASPTWPSAVTTPLRTTAQLLLQRAVEAIVPPRPTEPCIGPMICRAVGADLNRDAEPVVVACGISCGFTPGSRVRIVVLLRDGAGPK